MTSLVVGQWRSLEADPWRAAQTSYWCPERCQAPGWPHPTIWWWVLVASQLCRIFCIYTQCLIDCTSHKMRSISKHILLWPSDVKVKCKGYCLCLGSAPLFYSLGGKKERAQFRMGFICIKSQLTPSIYLFQGPEQQDTHCNSPGTARTAAVFRGKCCNSLPRGAYETSCVVRKVKFFPCVLYKTHPVWLINVKISDYCNVLGINVNP